MAEGRIILGHQGLGDHIVCNGLYRTLASNYGRCIIPVKAGYFSEVQQMFSDEPQIKVIKIPNFQWQEYVRNLSLGLQKNYSAVNLGVFGDEFMNNEFIRLDTRFYSQANVDFNCRWSNFHIPRNLQREQRAFLNFGLEKNSYYFLHEDSDRDFLIDRRFLNPNKHVFSPSKKHGMSIADYSFIIENASEIHCIESSFSAYIEQINPSVRKYAHRYSRPEARDDFRYEYTYKNSWSIYLQPAIDN